MWRVIACLCAVAIWLGVPSTAAASTVTIEIRSDDAEDVSRICVVGNRGRGNAVSTFRAAAKEPWQTRVASSVGEHSGYITCAPQLAPSSQDTVVVIELQTDGRWSGITVEEVVLRGQVVLVTISENLTRSMVSARVLGGDFAVSATHTAGGTDRIVLPIHRQLRSHTLRLPAGVSLDDEWVLAATTCPSSVSDASCGVPVHVERTPDDRLLVELPYGDPDSPRKLLLRGFPSGADSRSEEWRARADLLDPRPPAVIEMALVSALVRWKLEPCGLPEPTCPETIDLRESRSTCTRRKTREGSDTCVYACASRWPSAIEVPADVTLVHSASTRVEFDRRLRRIGLPMTGYPAGRENVTLKLKPREEGIGSSDRISHRQAGAESLLVRRNDGTWQPIRLDDATMTNGAVVPLPGNRCAERLQYTFEGSREYVAKAAARDGNTNRYDLEDPREAVRHVGVLLGVGGGADLPLGRADLPGGERRVPVGGHGRFEAAVLGWPAVPSWLAFEGGVGILVSRRPYFPLDSQGRPDFTIDRVWYLRVFAETAAILHFPGKKNLLGEVGVELGAGIGAGLPAFLEDRARVGPARLIGQAVVGLRLIDTPHGILGMRVRVIPRERVHGFQTDLRGEPSAAIAHQTSLLVEGVVRFDVTRIALRENKRMLGGRSDAASSN